MGQKKGSVLCVDDEPGILRSLKWLLQKEFDVTTAPSGYEALSLVRQSDFDVIISDQRMPGMTGVEFLREVCRIAPRAMRILLTGYSDLEAVTRSVNESEIYRFINKPWHINELPVVVGEAARIAQAHPAPTAITPSDSQGYTDSAPEIVEKLLVIDDDPQLAPALAQLLGNHAEVIAAGSLAAAIDILAGDRGIDLVLSDTKVGGSDATRLLKMLKERCPGVVTVACSSHVDAQEIISLINHGQVYRFVQKPFKPGHLKLVLTSALLKRKQLRDSPAFTQRHGVQKLSEEARQAFARELQQVEAAAPRPAGEAGTSLLQRVASRFRQLFG